MVAHQTPLSVGFSRQEYWSGLLFPSPEDRPNPGIESRFPALQADSLSSEPPGKPLTALLIYNSHTTKFTLLKWFLVYSLLLEYHHYFTALLS